MQEEHTAGRALDARVAQEVMGWKVFPIGAHQGDHTWLDDPANYPHVVDYGDRLLVWRGPDEDGEVWAPSTDIAAAWLVVEKMYRNGLRLSLDLFGGDPWWCEFADEAWTKGAQATADTAPLAICRAALEAQP